LILRSKNCRNRLILNWRRHLIFTKNITFQLIKDQKISEFVIKYTELEKRIGELNSQLTSMAQARTSEEQLILSKIDSFKEVMNDLNIRMGGMEKAFKDTLPALIESVRALSDLVGRLKREQ